MGPFILPPRTDLGIHPQGIGPAYLTGTWEDTGVPCPQDSPADTVAIWDADIASPWHCDGKGRWAYVRFDGQVQWHVELPATLTGTFNVARRTDVQYIAPVPMVTLPPVVCKIPALNEHCPRGIHTYGGCMCVPPPSSRWNGTCPRCGRGTYTGAWDVEHDGPCT